MIKCISRFLHEERANAAIIFTLSLIPLAFAAGTAVDYGRATALRSKLQAVTDSVTLSLCKTPLTTPTAQLQQTALTNIQSYFPQSTIVLDPLRVTSNPRQIGVVSRIAYPTTFVRLGNISSIPMAATATCTAQETYFEIALSVDTTGSMSQSSGTQSKLDALKQAATNFVDYMFTTGALPGHVKIALVPFAASVAVDPVANRNATWIDQQARSSLHWQNATIPAGYTYTRFDGFTLLRGAYSAWGWAGCLESLPYPLNVQDGAPTSGNPDSYYLPMFAPDEAGNGGQLSHVETSSGLTQGYVNSYLNDASGQSYCNYTPPDDRSRVGNACKYLAPAGVTTWNSSVGAIGPNFMCTARPLTRLTTDQAKLKTEIAALTANGNTNIHEGFMWGWRTVSPTSVFADASAYNRIDTKKIVVLMTDGMNTWGIPGGNTVLKSYYTAYAYVQNQNGSNANGRLSPTAQINVASPTESQARAAMDQLTREACTNARNAGIIIYTVAFSVPSSPIDQQGINLMSACAGNAERAFVANDSNGLIAAFGAIAQGIGKLRLTR